MALVDLWKKNKTDILNKHVQQIISIAGEGQLSDGNKTSIEYRNFLTIIPSDKLVEYATQCLEKSFDDSGFALQDTVNEIGRRLGFTVEDGRYRGVKGKLGFDGLWNLKTGHSIIVEVKTTDAYAINLDGIAAYRNSLDSDGLVNKNSSSVLIVVGRKDTGGLEAQIRGSRYAWDMRIISVDGLSRLLRLKENVDDPSVLDRISRILIPQEYTRLDGIIDLAFSAVEDSAFEGHVVPKKIGEDDDNKKTHAKPVNFHSLCADRIGQWLKTSLIKQTRTLYTTDDGQQISLAVSKQYEEKDSQGYWFAFHPYQRDALIKAKKGYVAFGCGSPNKIFIIPIEIFNKYLESMNTTEREGRSYWHVIIEGVGGEYSLQLKKGIKNPDISKYLISDR